MIVDGFNQKGERRKQPSFHPIFGRSLTVALRATFPGDATVFSEKLEFPELVMPSPEIRLTREEKRYVDFLATVVHDSDMSETAEGEIIFAPWLDVSEVECYHLTLRTQNIARNNSRFRWLKLARFGEVRPFGFNLGNKKYFINLIFNLEEDANDPEKVITDFVPVYGKIQDDQGGFVYLQISAEVGEEAIGLKVRRVEEASVPPYLAEAKP